MERLLCPGAPPLLGITTEFMIYLSVQNFIPFLITSDLSPDLSEH